jgi:hypothetical protein
MRQFQESIRPLEGIPASLQRNWERQRQASEHLRVQPINLGVLVTSLGAPRITVEQSGKMVFFGNTADAPGNHSY